MGRIVRGGLLSLAMAAVVRAQTLSYNVIDLGTLGGPGAAARGINNSSVVSGQSAVGARQHAFRWQEVPAEPGPGTTAVLTDLGVVAGTLDSDGRNIAATDVVVGVSDNHPAKWKGAAATALPALVTDNVGSAYAATRRVTVGYLTRFIPGWGIVNSRAVKWQKNQASEIHAVDATLSQAFDINKTGQIAGWASATAFGSPHAMRWSGGAATDVHAGFTGKTMSNGFALNSSGTVVGMAFSTSATVDPVPFLSTGPGGMVLLPLPPGTPRGRALDINKGGYVAGFGEPGSVALLWLPDNTPVVLQTVIPAGTGWTLRSANAINNHGEIAGWGIFSGQTRAFLLRPTTYHPGAVRVELLDPAAPHSDPNEGSPLLTVSEVTADPAKLAVYGGPAAGLVADGTTRLVLRVRTSDAGTVTVSIPGPEDDEPGTGIPERDGWVGPPGVKPDGSSVTVNTVNIGGKNMAFAVYRAPEELLPEYDDEATSELSLQVRFDGPPGTDPATVTVPVQVDRPPVLAMHGIWSNLYQAFGVPNGFVDRTRQQIHGLTIEGPDYPNASHFSTNAKVVTDAIKRLRDAKRLEGIAMAQADVVGHSMGGVLSRKWAAEGASRTPANYKEGEINRLITVDSPHCGSPLVDVAWQLRRFAEDGGPAVLLIFDGIFTAAGVPLGLGAIEDLRMTAPAIAELNSKATDVRCHVVVGDTPIPVDLTNPLVTGNLAPFYEALGTFGGAAVTGNIPTHSDLIVGLDSQLAGLTAPNFTKGTHSHSGAANQAPMIDAMVGLLRTRPSSTFFSNGFPTGCPPPPPLVMGTLNALNTIHLLLSLPLADTIVSAGTNTVVEIVNDVENGLTKAVIFLGDQIRTITSVPWSTVIPVPAPLIGDVPIRVIGQHVDGTISTVERIIHVVTSAALNSLTALPPVISLHSPGGTIRPRLEGVYSDAVVRDLTRGSTGTTYLSSNTGVVTVDANGWLTPVANGSATVTATNAANGTKSVVIPVTVALVPESDLTLAGSGAPLVLFAGDTAAWSFSAGNSGPDAVRPARVFVSGPPIAALTGAAAAAGGWNNSAAPVWSAAPFAAGGSAALSVNVRALTPGSGTLTAAITGTNGRDGNGANNALSVPVRVFADPHFAFAADGGGALHCATETGVLYTLETSPDLDPDHWTPATSVAGDGTEKSFPLPPGAGIRLFCRLRLTVP